MDRTTAVLLILLIMCRRRSLSPIENYKVIEFASGFCKIIRLHYHYILPQESNQLHKDMPSTKLSYDLRFPFLKI